MNTAVNKQHSNQVDMILEYMMKSPSIEYTARKIGRELHIPIVKSELILLYLAKINKVTMIVPAKSSQPASYKIVKDQFPEITPQEVPDMAIPKKQANYTLHDIPKIQEDLMVYFRHTNPARVSVEDLAQIINVDRHTTYRALKKLIAQHKIILIEKGRGKNKSVYSVPSADQIDLAPSESPVHEAKGKNKSVYSIPSTDMIAFEAAESPVSGSEPAGNTNTLPVQENITKRQLQAAGPDSQIPHTISTDDLVDNLLMIVQELIERTHGRTERDNKLFEELKIYKAAVNSLTPVGNIDGKPLYVSSSETAIDDVKSRPMP